MMIPFLHRSLLALLHLVLAIYIWRDAKTRNDTLLFSIPVWVWGLMGLSLGVGGLVIYWLANCSRWVKGQTIEGGEQVTDQAF